MCETRTKTKIKTKNRGGGRPPFLLTSAMSSRSPMKSSTLEDPWT
jgi:hypothetical protein